MFLYATLFSVLAALGGLVLASYIFRGKTSPWIPSLIHAAFGLASFLVLLYIMINGPQWPEKLHFAVVALVLFSVALVSGAFLFGIHCCKNVPAKAIVVGHGAVALVGVAILLLSFAF